MKYPTPTLNALPDGAVLDQRFKLAVELAKTPGYLRFYASDEIERFTLNPPKSTFLEFICDVADKLYEQGEKRGWITPPPTPADLPAAELAHVQRAAEANVRGQLHAQQVAQDEQARVQRVVGGGFAQ